MEKKDPIVVVFGIGLVIIALLGVIGLTRPAHKGLAAEGEGELEHDAGDPSSSDGE